MSWEVMRMVNLTGVIVGLHAEQAWRCPSAGDVAHKRTANKRTKALTKISFKHVYVGLAIAPATLSC
ncbi:hypothetical protein D3C84_1038400 [compost metagenome]